MSDRSPLVRVHQARESALLIANLNSIVLDFVARTAVGGTDLSYFIIKQLPVLRPYAFQERFKSGQTFADLIIPRVLELTYNTKSLESFAHDLGYYGPPFPWNEQRRHCVRCEIDAIFAYMYGLDRSDLEWILDALPPSQSFPSLKKNELRKFGEYRTRRYVLDAFDSLKSGKTPDLIGSAK